MLADMFFQIISVRLSRKRPIVNRLQYGPRVAAAISQPSDLIIVEDTDG